MERLNPPDFEVQVTSGDVPWRTVGRAWVNEDGSIFVRVDGADVMFMLVKP